MDKLHKRKEYKSLNSALLSDENISDYIVGHINSGEHLIALTDQRIIFIRKTLFGEKTEVFKLNEIALSPFKSGIFGTNFAINHHKISFKDKNKAQAIYNALSVHSTVQNQNNIASVVQETTSTSTQNKVDKKKPAEPGCGTILFVIIVGSIIGWMLIVIDKGASDNTDSDTVTIKPYTGSQSVQQAITTSVPKHKPIKQTAPVADKDKVVTAAPKKPPEKSKGGTLHKATLTEWKKATLQNQQATCAEFILTIFINEDFKPELQKAIKDTTGLALLANECVNFFDSLTEGDIKGFGNNVKANEAFAMGVMMMGWLKSSE